MGLRVARAEAVCKPLQRVLGQPGKQNVGQVPGVAARVTQRQAALGQETQVEGQVVADDGRLAHELCEGSKHRAEFRGAVDLVLGDAG